MGVAETVVRVVTDGKDPVTCYGRHLWRIIYREERYKMTTSISQPSSAPETASSAPTTAKGTGQLVVLCEVVQIDPKIQ
jgi:hypothetical protein